MCVLVYTHVVQSHPSPLGGKLHGTFGTPVRKLGPARTRMQTNAHTRTQHTRMHTQNKNTTRKEEQNTRTHTHTYTHARARMHMHSCTNKGVSVSVHVCAGSCVCGCVYVCMPSTCACHAILTSPARHQNPLITRLTTGDKQFHSIFGTPVREFAPTSTHVHTHAHTNAAACTHAHLTSSIK